MCDCCTLVCNFWGKTGYKWKTVFKILPWQSALLNLISILNMEIFPAPAQNNMQPCLCHTAVPTLPIVKQNPASLPRANPDTGGFDYSARDTSEYFERQYLCPYNPPHRESCNSVFTHSCRTLSCSGSFSLNRSKIGVNLSTQSGSMYCCSKIRPYFFAVKKPADF